MKTNYPDLKCRMLCIGVGSGPKNVLVEFEDGSKTVVPYAVWKHRLSKNQIGDHLSDNVYLVAAGFVQKFPNKEAVVERDVNGGKVRDFTIKALGTQKLVRISVFLSDFPAFSVEDGDFVAAEGKYQASGDQGQFHNITGYRLAVNGVSIKKSAREVVNNGGASQQNTSAASGGGDSNPF